MCILVALLGFLVADLISLIIETSTYEGKHRATNDDD